MPRIDHPAIRLIKKRGVSISNARLSFFPCSDFSSRPSSSKNKNPYAQSQRNGGFRFQFRFAGSPGIRCY
jgi:hypothetical protein